MKRGPRPQPTAIRELHGNPAKRPLPRNEPKPAGELHRPPKHLSKDQRAAWRYAIQNAPRGLLKRLDRGVMAVWIVAEDLHRQATEQQNQLGKLFIKAPSGYPVQSPHIAILQKQGLLMIRAAEQLGFTPASRTRIEAPLGALPPVHVDEPVAGPEVVDAADSDDLESYLASGPKSIN